MNNIIMGEDKKERDLFSLSKDEFLEFIENKLWSQFQKRLWSIVGIFLTIITLAGIFGIPYYINNELKSRLVRLESNFEVQRKKLINTVKLLTFSELKRDEKKHELLYQVLVFKEKLNTIQDTLTTNISNLSELQRILSTIYYENKVYEMQKLRFNLRDSVLLETRVLPYQLRHQEIVSNGYMTGSAASHPVNDGTLGGVLEDIKIKIAHLQAMNGVIENLEEELIVFDNEGQTEKLQNKILLKVTFDKKNKELYDTLLLNTLNNYFTKERSTEILDYNELYKVKLDFKINNSEQ